MTLRSCFKLMMNLPKSAFPPFKKQLPNSAILIIMTSSIPAKCQGYYTEASASPPTCITTQFMVVKNASARQGLSITHLPLGMGLLLPSRAENGILIQLIY